MLIVQIAKRADGAGVLRCTRADGSVTWQKQTRHALHFALHDLTHFAVESTLGLRRGFFGLIAEGWEIEDTTGKGARGPLPQEALEVEHIVGFFDTERGSGVFLTAEDYNHHSGVQASSSGRPGRACSPTLTSPNPHLPRPAFLARSALEPGSTMELQFE